MTMTLDELEQAINELDSTGTSRYVEHEGEFTAINQALSDHASDSGAHPQIMTAVQGLLALKVNKTTTVNGYSLNSNIALSREDFGIESVDNTSDLDKPISTATQTALDDKANLDHTHLISHITGLQTALDAKVPITRTVNGHALNGNINVTRSDLSFVSAASNISDAATNAAVDAATNGPTDAPTNAPTNYGALAAILGGEVNSNNAKQNATATNVNTLAGIVNANATKQNAGFTILNALAGKFNLNLDILENNGLMAA